MNKVRATGWVLGCAVVAILGACHSAATRIYSLEATRPAILIDTYRAPALRIDTVSVPASWDRGEILSLSAAGKLQIDEFDHWSAPLPQIVRQVLSDDLDQRLPAGSVIFPRLPKSIGALGISVDILDFTVVGTHVSMRASWLIVPPAGSQSAKRSAASLEGSLTSTEPAAIARAWSELVGQLADRIAADCASFDKP
jgi:uncharacterized lipoprotein YmbA